MQIDGNKIDLTDGDISFDSYIKNDKDKSKNTTNFTEEQYEEITNKILKNCMAVIAEYTISNNIELKVFDIVNIMNKATMKNVETLSSHLDDIIDKALSNK